jgi:hypothetical protein
MGRLNPLCPQELISKPYIFYENAAATVPGLLADFPQVRVG